MKKKKKKKKIIVLLCEKNLPTCLGALQNKSKTSTKTFSVQVLHEINLTLFFYS